MAKMLKLEDLFFHELKDLYSAEEQLIKSFPKMEEKATDKKLKQNFKSHLLETEKQRDRLKKIAGILNIKIEGEKCDAMEGLIEEAEDFLAEEATPEVMDAGIIATAQKIEHYEIAGYGTATYYAEMLGHTEVKNLLAQSLKEELRTDEKLNILAIEGINEEAK